MPFGGRVALDGAHALRGGVSVACRTAETVHGGRIVFVDGRVPVAVGGAPVLVR